MTITNKTYLELPIYPLATQFELEFTNVCNADCTACPRYDLPKAGMLSENTLKRILNYYQHTNLIKSQKLPDCIVSGGGEPLINKNAPALLKEIVENGFNLSLTTNASRITQKLAEEILSIDISCIYVSFWGIYQEEYESAMKLPFKSTLSKLELLAKLAAEKKVPLLVKWLKTPEIQSTNEDIEKFWTDKGINFVNGYHDEWNRGGLNKERETSIEKTYLPEPNRRIWCTDIYFSDSYTWSGDCILCCCNYFTSKQLKLGNVHIDSYEIINQRKLEYLNQRPIPEMCQVCKLPRNNRGKWLSRTLFDKLSPKDQDMLAKY